jgi:hypothetical protein
MPITTLDELFRVGGQHTVESVLERPGASFEEAIDALQRRFGPDLQLPGTELAIFVGRVEDAIRGAEILNRGERIIPGEIPQFPGISSNYQYTVIVSMPDPEAPDDPLRRIEVPLTVPSAEPLDLEAVREYIANLLSDWDPPRDTIPGGPAADLIRRDVLIRSRVEEFGGDASDIVSVGILGVYRG